MAIRDATSPACAPPMPSATTNTGARAYALSSLSRRWRPVSVLQIVSAARSISVEVRELGIADPDSVTGMQGLRTGERLVVQKSAVRGPEILDHDNVALTRDSRVARGREWILETDLHIPTPERGAALEVVCGAGLVTGGALHEQPGFESVRVRIDETVGCGVHPGGVVDRLHVSRVGPAAAPAQITQRAPRDPHQEQVEHDQEAELEAYGDWLEHRPEGYSTWNVITDVPSSISSPGRIPSGPWIRRPLS